MIGETVSHYNIVEKLGEGGMGVVYRALDTSLDRDVALKFLPTHLKADASFQKRFHNEAKTASALDHPNICTIYGFGEHKGQPYIAMGFVAGQTLDQKMSGKAISLDQAIEIAKQVARGIAAEHQLGIVHRDLKPGNIMIDQHGVVKIMDFGLARQENQEQVTKTGATMGTLAYMSPEQVRGEAVDGRTDLWSLGVILYEMLTGNRPFAGEYEAAIMFSVLNEDPDDLDAIQKFSPAMYTLIHGLLEKNPEHRITSADEVLAHLNKMQTAPVNLLEESGSTITLSKKKPGAPTSSLFREIRRRRFLPIVGSYLAVAIGLLEVGPYIIDFYQFDPGWHQILLIWVLAGFPLAGLIAFYHGSKGPDRVTRLEALIFAGIIVVAAGLSFATWRSSQAEVQATIQEQGAPLQDLGPDLTEMRTALDSVRSEMSTARRAALQAGANTKAKSTFDSAQRREEEGSVSEKSGDAAGYQAADRAFRDAQGGYEKALSEARLYNRQITQSAQEQEVIAARSAMLEAKMSVPGSSREKEREPQYGLGAEAEKEAERLYQAREHQRAINSFGLAEKFYQESAKNFETALVLKADEARTAMQEAKDKVDEASYTGADYAAALQLETEAKNAYDNQDYDLAANGFRDAALAYSQLVAQAALAQTAERNAADKELQETEDGVQRTIQRFKRAVVQGDIEVLKKLVVNATADEEQKWQMLFNRTKNRRIDIGISDQQLEKDQARLDLLTKITYRDNKNRRQQANYSYTWKIEQIGGSWVITLFTSRPIQ